MSPPLLLDLDGSLLGLDQGTVVPLRAWQEAIRFGCGRRIWREFARSLRAALPAKYGTVLCGSGDFHHVSHLLLSFLSPPRPIDVIVLDNHPDNMRFPFGIHCGSWVRHAAELPQVRRIHVVGITSPDVGLGQAWENHLLPLYRGKVNYWTQGVATGWARQIGLGSAIHSHANSDDMIAALGERLAADPAPVYLSIDKDVFAPEVVRTNWDQGRLSLGHVHRVIELVADRLIGSDITGEVSVHAYRTRWKRWLSARDSQPEIPLATLAEWQAQQMALNRSLLARLNRNGNHGG